MNQDLVICQVLLEQWQLEPNPALTSQANQALLNHPTTVLVNVVLLLLSRF
ncbi:hypothetical protein [Limosilactobacillus pontis]|uniref:hypothetical protein n=1 Tax=Limosilactobacillus pontis TaxID=35787 RepID=UPI00241C8296|nr:hypothetical protein [Limosilactobacillus pontis]